MLHSYSHPSRVFCVARSSYPCPVFCIACLPRIYVVCSMLHVLCCAFVAHMYSMSRVRHTSVSRVLRYALVAYVTCSVSRVHRTRVFCIARSSRTYINKSRACCASVARSSRICVADCASRARRVFATCVVCRARVFRHRRSLHLCLGSFL